MDSLHANLPNGESVKLIFSANQPQDLASRVEPLLGSWQITPSGKGLKKEFIFKTFNSAWKFMDTIAQECKVQRHHPEWSNLYNKVTIEWTTHRPEGMSVKDADMAEFCDRMAAEIGLNSSAPVVDAGTGSARKPAQ
ncbi:transcriptional coactivator/pterin dehydratase [Didymella exigua CBS 183.55]|uniref:4a-hydroxytetrahydrobiopterin dehydratase n=1 Tax=Didymella exigua CBS 183.55 TaxID=1150837 RepID=A0A6A5RYM8_9PLEO|nr:transcriptional coactivator/pterin dehydratase [Didymella exigua CBS 183.55]KAF1932733.1 transcriptional coactivator/pterin dehydratase [Didymella exigua CBS 183.55]